MMPIWKRFLAVIGIVDVDNDEDFCYELNVRAIPTTIRFVNGMEVERIVANQPLDFWMKII
ncbi:MAG: thioredoxin family protein [Erysipelotrichaceae bacterium]|nr:thioredoxin family protein [Erysipelotrichaceae bacterium]